MGLKVFSSFFSTYNQNNQITPTFSDFPSRLPEELFLMILSFLPPKNCLMASHVSRNWRRIATDFSLWPKYTNNETGFLVNPTPSEMGNPLFMRKISYWSNSMDFPANFVPMPSLELYNTNFVQACRKMAFDHTFRSRNINRIFEFHFDLSHRFLDFFNLRDGFNEGWREGSQKYSFTGELLLSSLLNRDIYNIKYTLNNPHSINFLKSRLGNTFCFLFVPGSSYIQGCSSFLGLSSYWCRAYNRDQDVYSHTYGQLTQLQKSSPHMFDPYIFGNVLPEQINSKIRFVAENWEKIQEVSIAAVYYSQDMETGKEVKYIYINNQKNIARLFWRDERILEGFADFLIGDEDNNRAQELLDSICLTTRSKAVSFKDDRSDIAQFLSASSSGLNKVLKKLYDSIVGHGG